MTAARCRCSHTKGQHYRTRTGSPMCVGPCGCMGYRPPTELVLPAPGLTEKAIRTAALVICGEAADKAEATDLLAMCGLINTTTKGT